MAYTFSDPTPILLYTPKELMEKIINRIEKERLKQNITQEELSKKTGIPTATYRNFIYKKQISLINFIKILKKLRMEDALKLLVDIPIEEEIADVLEGGKKRKRARKKD